MKNLIIHNLFDDHQIQIPQTPVVLLGKSGSGKSTLFNRIKNLHDIEITYDQTIIKKQDIGLILQTAVFFPHWSLLDNLIIPQILNLNIEYEEAYQNMIKMLEKFQMIELITQLKEQKSINGLFVHHFSGGEEQRLDIIRSLLLRPKILLMDEPISALDRNNINIFRDILKNINIPTILTLHHIDIAHQIGKYFLFMDHFQIIEHGDNILNSPQSFALKQYLNAE